jgi:Protein of unknown function (DUF2877)
MSAVLSPVFQIHALNIGALVPESGYHGEVRLLTSATAYVDGFSASNKPLVLSLDLAKARLPSSPTSLQLNTRDWDTLAVGTFVSIENGQLLIQNSESLVLVVTLSHRVDASPKPATIVMHTRDTSGPALSLAFTIQQLRNHGGQALSAASARLHERMKLLVAAVDRPSDLPANFNDQFASLDHALHRLLGFGPGLTPTGDDALTGFLSALQTIGDIEMRAHANTIGTRLLTLLSASPDSTTFVSAQMLRSSVAGHFGQTVHQLLEAITTMMHQQTNLLQTSPNRPGSQFVEPPLSENHSPLPIQAQPTQALLTQARPTHAQSSPVTHDRLHSMPGAPMQSARRRTPELQAAVVELLNRGATSGADTLVGILSACSVLHTNWSKAMIV